MTKTWVLFYYAFVILYNFFFFWQCLQKILFEALRGDQKKWIFIFCWVSPGTQSEPRQTSKMELFAKINGWKSLTIFAKNAILYVWLGSKYTSEDLGTNMLKENFVKTFFLAAILVIISWDANVMQCSFTLKLTTASCNCAYLSQINK